MDEKGMKRTPNIDKSTLGNNSELDPCKGKKKKHKGRKKKYGIDNEFLEENCTAEASRRQTFSVEEDIAFMRYVEEESNTKKRKKIKRGKGDEMVNGNIIEDKENRFPGDNQQSKKNKRKICDHSSAGIQDVAASKPSKKGKITKDDEFKGNDGDLALVKVGRGDANAYSIASKVDCQGKKMEDKKKLNNKSQRTIKGYKSDEGEHFDFTEAEGQSKKMKKLGKKSQRIEDKQYESNEGDPCLAESNECEVDDQGEKMKANKKKLSNKSKRVTFSDKMDVSCDGLVRGKRFTLEEDEKIKKSVYGYIESHGLGEEGLDMVLHCGSHPEVRDCWKEIGAVLPQRPVYSIYYRAHILLERGEKRKWTPEEYELIRKIHEQRGADWKMIAEALGKSRVHVKDAWRRIKLTNTNKGRWSQEEYQNLFDLVNLDLRVRALEKHRKSKHGMLRDNIGWEAIGNKLATRTSQHCCKKWYEQLTSPMVARGLWNDTDDYRLVNALFTLDACCMEDVEWDNLLEHRSGDVCRKRWNQMVRYIGEHWEKSFPEQVEILAKRFCPDLLEAREAFDIKPVVC